MTYSWLESYPHCLPDLAFAFHFSCKGGWNSWIPNAIYLSSLFTGKSRNKAKKQSYRSRNDILFILFGVWVRKGNLLSSILLGAEPTWIWKEGIPIGCLRASKERKTLGNSPNKDLNSHWKCERDTLLAKQRETQSLLSGIRSQRSKPLKLCLCVLKRKRRCTFASWEMHYHTKTKTIRVTLKEGFSLLACWDSRVRNCWGKMVKLGSRWSNYWCWIN